MMLSLPIFAHAEGSQEAGLLNAVPCSTEGEDAADTAAVI